jgi:hypothetical protein
LFFWQIFQLGHALLSFSIFLALFCFKNEQWTFWAFLSRFSLAEARGQKIHVSRSR